jgi:acyl-coenzyme A thioesterase PaaI-like protein
MSILPAAPDDEQRLRAGRSIRRLGHAFVGHQATSEQVAELADTLDRLTDQLRAGGPRRREDETFPREERPPVADGDRMLSYDDRPFSGRSSPWGIDLEVHRRGDEIEARFTLDAAHEGAPGRSHGGIVAGMFDDVFGFVLDIVQQSAFTGELKVRYVAPTPLHRELACRGRLRERVGRKLWIEGELVDTTVKPEQVVARGQGLFIAVDVEQMVVGASSRETARLPAPPDEA